MNQLDNQQDSRLEHFDDVASIVRQTLQMSSDVKLDVDTPLLGAIPEFDSMSVITVLTVLEEQFGFFVDDDDISAETFATLGSLLDYVNTQLAG